jgi:site-specific DNA recombinase
MMKKAALYARVSSQKQKEGETIDSQLHALQDFAHAERYEIPENWIFLDNGVSGTTLQRPALDELRDMIKTEPIEALLIHTPDRLSRSYPHQLVLLEEFRRYGVSVLFIKNPPAKNDTPEGIMMNHFQGIFAEYERALILDRSRRGRIHKAKLGDQSILPGVPFGYRKTKQDGQTVIEVIERDASVVKLIFKLYVYDQISLNEISRRLCKDGIKSPKGCSYWHKSSVAFILKNRAYIGSAYYGKTEAYEGISDKIRYYKSGKVIKPKYAKKARPEEEWFEISIPAIISENDFELAQERVNKNKEFALRNTREPSLLQGLIVCGECGCPFYKRRQGKPNYHCRSHGDGRIKKCSNTTVGQKDLDELVYDKIVQMLQNPSIIRQELQRREKEGKGSDEIEREEVAIKKQLENIRVERERLLDAYQSGILDLDALSQRSQGLDKRRNTLDKQIKAVQASRLEKEIGTNWEKVFERTLERIKESSTELPFKEKQQLIRLIVEKIVVSKEEIKIMHCISPKNFQEEVQLRCDDPEGLAPLAGGV